MIPVTARLAIACVWLSSFAGAQEAFLEHRIEKIASGFQYIGGLARARGGHLYFSDSPHGRINQWTAGQSISFLPVELKQPAGLDADDHGRLIVCEAGARRIVRVKNDNTVETLASTFDGHKLNAPRDVAVRKDGTVFFTDPAFGSARDSAEISFHGVYRPGSKGEAVALARWNKRPSGIAVSPDGKTLYVANGDERTIHAFDLDRQGNASNGRILVSGMDGVPKALRTDGQGRIYAAAHKVYVYSPGGVRLGQIETAERPTSLAFGEAEGRTLFIATRTSVYRVEFGAPR
jgi:gluconolactonase